MRAYVNILLAVHLMTIVSIANAQTWSKFSNNGLGGNSYARTFSVDENNSILYASNILNGKPAVWDGNGWLPLDTLSLSGNIFSSCFYRNELHLGGTHVSIANNDTTVVGHISVKWNGNSWELFTQHSSMIFTMFVDEINNLLYIGGNFSEINGVVANGIAVWNGITWSPIGTGVNGSVYALFIDDENGKLYAGGSFTQAGAKSATNIAFWDGIQWSSLGDGLASREVNTINKYQGEIYAGGGFLNSGSTSIDYFAKWNGNNWVNAAPGMNGFARYSCVYGGELYVAGEFTEIDGQVMDRIARWNGNNWNKLGEGLKRINGGSNYILVSALTIFKDELIVSGRFDSAGQVPATNIAKWTMPIVSVEELNNEGIGLRISPNPIFSGQQINLKRTNTNEKALLNIFNLEGKLIKSIQISKGINHASFSLEQSKGIYLYQYQTEADKLNIQTGKLLLLE